MASAGNSDNSNEVILIAYEKAINTGPPSRREQERQYYEEQPVPQGELTLEKSGVGKMLLASSVVAAIAGGYYGVKFYKSRQEGLVRDFAYSMMLYWGDAKASRITIKEYQRKVGPIINVFHRSDMFKAYVKALAQDKPLSIKSLQDLAANAKALGVSNSAAAKIIVKAGEELVPYQKPTELWERNANKPSVLGKLLWLTQRVFPEPGTIAALRGRFPAAYAGEVIDVLQRTLTEQTYKDIVNAAGGPEKGSQAGFLQLGLTQSEADGIVAAMAEEKRRAAEEAARLAAEKAEEEKVKKIMAGPDLSSIKGKANKDSDDKDKVERAPGSNEYECTKCGFTLFVAPGREFKFYGDDFKCTQCGAGKDAFKNNAVQ